MENILSYINKWGMAAMLFLGIIIFFNTCGVKGNNEKLESRVKSFEEKIMFNDSLNMEITSVEREISLYETAREVVYTNNAIVRTVERPDDIMNKYSIKIKELQTKKEKLNASRK